MKPEIGKVWTTDTLYREFPRKIAFWKNKGARFVNLETSPFYAVARAKGIKAVYLSVVSDSVDRRKWSGWSSNLEEAVDKMWGISLEMINSL
jgi:purine-nucleoside phosphorylase